MRVAFEIALGVGELRLVQRLLGDRLVELRLIGGRIDLGEQVAFLDVLAFLEIDAEDVAIDLRPNGDSVPGLRRANTVEVDRDIADAGLGCDDGHRVIGPGFRTTAAAQPAGLLLGCIATEIVEAGPEHRQDDRKPQRALQKALHVPPALGWTAERRQ